MLANLMQLSQLMQMVVPHTFAVSHGLRARWAWLTACLAVARIPPVSAVAVGAANVAALQEDGGSGFLGHLPARRERSIDMSNTPGWMLPQNCFAVKVTIAQLFSPVAHANLALTKVVGGEVAQAADGVLEEQRRRTGTLHLGALSQEAGDADQVTLGAVEREIFNRWEVAALDQRQRQRLDCAHSWLSWGDARRRHRWKAVHERCGECGCRDLQARRQP